MKNYKDTPQLSDEHIRQGVQEILDANLDTYPLKKTYSGLLALLDLTTLEGADNTKKVQALCQKASSFAQMGLGLPNVAAVCVYPTLVGVARKALEGTRIHVASVAGAFPSGLSPLKLRLEEVRYAVSEGADEIDMVISRGRFLEEDYAYVYDEIAAHREACGDAHLKVILETGELGSATNIRRACEIALDAGAHFLKTSTGKVQPAATPEAMYIMLQSISDHYENTGKIVGIKPAGGIADPETALKYYCLTDQVLGSDWLSSDWLRIGASRLADALTETVRGMK